MTAVSLKFLTWKTCFFGEKHHMCLCKRDAEAVKDSVMCEKHRFLCLCVRLYAWKQRPTLNTTKKNHNQKLIIETFSQLKDIRAAKIRLGLNGVPENQLDPETLKKICTGKQWALTEGSKVKNFPSSFWEMESCWNCQWNGHLRGFKWQRGVTAQLEQFVHCPRLNFPP